jgi:DNA repair protein REV1
MSKPLSRSLSRGSSDLFEPDDPEFLQTLLHMKLPGDVLTPPPRSVVPSTKEAAESEEVIDIPEARNARKRPRSPSPSNHDPTNTQEIEHELSGEDSDTYGAAHFGGFGEYMRRKRAKLQIQNTQIAQADSTTSSSAIFRGLAIYVSGRMHVILALRLIFFRSTAGPSLQSKTYDS